MLAVLAPLIGAAVRRADRRVQRELQRANAFAADRAVHIPRPSPIVRWRLARLKTAGVVRPAAEGRYYWHEETWQEYRRARRLRALAVVGLLLAAMAFLWWHGLLD